MSKQLIYGKGINDADYVVKPTINGKQVRCPFYVKWQNMLRRAYDPKYHQRYPTYIGTTVCNEWLYFSNFKSWMAKQDWEGKELDKDILIPDNKHYSPETCVFVSRAVNLLLTDHGAARGKYPQGVTWDKQNKKYQVSIRLYGKRKHLGRFTTVPEAYDAYLSAKIDYVLLIATTQEQRVANGLALHTCLMFDEYLEGGTDA